MSWNQAINGTKEWAQSKGFDNPHKQFRKHEEEGGEVAAALCRADVDMRKDAYGDQCVTLTNTLLTAGVDLSALLLAQAQVDGCSSIDDWVDGIRADHLNEGATLDTLFEMQVYHKGMIAYGLATANRYAIETAAVDQFTNLVRLSAATGDDLLECFHMVIDIITKRRGAMKDGVFVKEEDLVTA